MKQFQWLFAIGESDDQFQLAGSFGVLMHGLMAKFSQHANRQKKLLETGRAYLVECARGDHLWVCGISLYDGNSCDIAGWKGKNIPGFALMEVRESLKHNGNTISEKRIEQRNKADLAGLAAMYGMFGKGPLSIRMLPIW